MRESVLCKVEGDEECYHYINEPAYLRNTDSQERIATTCDIETYCGKIAKSVPHEWCYQENSNGKNPYQVMFTWDKMKLCPVCQKIREEEERSAWGF